MKVFGLNITRGGPVEAKESAVGGSMVVSPGQPVWTSRDYAAFAKEGYQTNVVANRCISSIAEAIASVPLGIFKGDTEFANHPLKELLAKPNPQQNYSEYVQAVVSYLLISGNSYQEGVTATGPEVKELYPLRPDRMKVVPAANGLPKAYTYEVAGKTTTWDVDYLADVIPIWHMKLFNPADDWYGLAPIEAGAYAIDVHTECMKHIQALLQNSGSPSGALVYDDKAGGPLGDESFNRLKTELQDHHQGAANAGRPMLLDGGVSWTPMGLSPADLEIVETKNAAARDICLAFGVPPLLLGIGGDNTYANYSEARLAFWEDTVIPLLNQIIGDWQTWLADPAGVTIKPDFDEIPAIVERRAVKWKSLQESDVLTINEKRKAMGYEDIKDGDVVYIKMGVVPLGSEFDSAGPIDPVDQKAIALIAGYETANIVNIK